MIEKKWAAVPPVAFIAQGTKRGRATISSTAGFKVKQEVAISHPTLPALVLEVKRVLNDVQLELGPVGSSIATREDLAQYDTDSIIYADEQKRPSIPQAEIDRAVYEEEPAVALRTFSVDSLGNPYTQDNPLPVALFASSVENPNAWNLDGNEGVQPSNFLGTTDASDLIFKTSNEFRMVINPDGKIGLGEANPQAILHIRGHAAFPGTGRLINTFAVQTINNGFNQAWSVQVADKTSALVTVRVTARRKDGVTRASFIRTFTVFREGSLAQVMGPVQSDYTAMSVDGFEVKLSWQGDTVFFNVKAPSEDPTNPTNWFGSVDIDLTK